MRDDHSDKHPGPFAEALEHEAPNTLEGWSVLHQVFRLRREAFGTVDAARRERVLRQADGESALFPILGHKGDLLLLHFRRNFDELGRAQADIAALELSAYLEQVGSYVSMVEIGLYEATVALNSRLAAEGMRPHSSEWKRSVEEELATQREKMETRLWPKIPARRHLCFYPMNKRRAGADNWYQLPIEERRRLMHEHGMIGRRH